MSDNEKAEMRLWEEATIAARASASYEGDEDGITFFGFWHQTIVMATSDLYSK